jgi:hypothetical protein
MKPVTPTGKTVAKTAAPPRLRLPLNTIDDCKRQIACVYRLARTRSLEIAEASKLVNMLYVLARLISESELEGRIARLEATNDPA